MSRRAFFVLLLLAFLDSSAFGLIYPLFSSMMFDPKLHFVAPETSAAIRGLWVGVFISATPLVAMLVSPLLETSPTELAEGLSSSPACALDLSRGYGQHIA